MFGSVCGPVMGFSKDTDEASLLVEVWENFKLTSFCVKKFVINHNLIGVSAGICKMSTKLDFLSWLCWCI